MGARYPLTSPKVCPLGVLARLAAGRTGTVVDTAGGVGVGAGPGI